MYNRVKDSTHLMARMHLSIRDKQYLHVYIWESNQAMHDNHDVGYDGDFAAAYCGMAYKINADTGELRTGKKFGEIHLVNGNFGAGVFAHELQHFVMDWIDIYGIEDNPAWIETICGMVGDMTNKFWVWFYDTFKIEL